MSLYQIQHDGQSDYVEANGIGNAEQVWLAHVRSEPDNADFNEEPDSIALLSTNAVIRQDQPCQKTNVNAGTAQVMTTTHFAAETSGSPIVESAPTADASRTTPPSEPEVMKALRSTLKQSLGFQLLWYEVTEIVTHIDTLSARLKRAEELLRRAVPFLADNGHMERTIDAFLAGKGEA